MSDKTRTNIELGGWILFIFSALCFIASSIHAEDPFGLMGGLIFLAACFVFLVPLLTPRKFSGEPNSSLRPCKYFQYLPGLFRAGNLRSHVAVVALKQPVPEYHRDVGAGAESRSEKY